MADAEERTLTAEEIEAQLAAMRKRRDQAKLPPRTTKQRRQAEHKQLKSRVNGSLLRAPSNAHEDTWTIRAKSERVRAVKNLAEELSEPGAKVSIAALMDEAIELLLTKYRGSGG